MKVLTIGTFDIPHAGHAAFLRQAASLGESLTVGVLSDQFTLITKGKTPLYDQDERRDLVEAMGYEAYIEMGRMARHKDESADFSHPSKAIEMSPCIVAVGSDWMRNNYLARLGILTPEGLGITIAYVPYTFGS